MRTRSVIFFSMMCLVFLGLPGLAAQETASLSWYAKGEGTITLEPVPAVAEWSLPIAGTTNRKSLMIKVKKDGGPEHNLTIPLDPQGAFGLFWLFKDGPGQYTVTFFGSAQAKSLSYAGLGYLRVSASANLPVDTSGLELNSNVLAYVDSVMGTQVGRGECWDLAQEALDLNLADWTRPLTYGKLLDPARDEILPGDIIQFKTVKITEKLAGGGTRWETLGAPDHTAVIYEVLGPLQYRLAHQNLGGKRFVQITDLNLNNMTSGRFWIYRPEAIALPME